MLRDGKGCREEGDMGCLGLATAPEEGHAASGEGEARGGRNVAGLLGSVRVTGRSGGSAGGGG